MLYAIFSGSYSHLDGKPLADYYDQQDVTKLRQQLVELSVAVGNRYREGSAWTPFQETED
jgi:hypothetical protein